MKYIIIEKAWPKRSYKRMKADTERRIALDAGVSTGQIKPYVRTKRGKLEHVKGYSQGISSDLKEGSPIMKKKSPGDDLKPLSQYKTMYDLGIAIKEELSKVVTPPGFGGFAVGYEASSKSILISYDEPRELRHPDEYAFPEYELSSARDRYRKVDENVHKIVKKLEDQGVRVVEAFDSSDATWIAGRPKESMLVKSMPGLRVNTVEDRMLHNIAASRGEKWLPIPRPSEVKMLKEAAEIIRAYYKPNKPTWQRKRKGKLESVHRRKNVILRRPTQGKIPQA
jgi:hypothetical protein